MSNINNILLLLNVFLGSCSEYILLSRDVFLGFIEFNRSNFSFGFVLLFLIWVVLFYVWGVAFSLQSLINLLTFLKNANVNFCNSIISNGVFNFGGLVNGRFGVLEQLHYFISHNTSIYGFILFLFILFSVLVVLFFIAFIGYLSSYYCWFDLFSYLFEIFDGIGDAMDNGNNEEVWEILLENGINDIAKMLNGSGWEYISVNFLFDGSFKYFSMMWWVLYRIKGVFSFYFFLEVEEWSISLLGFQYLYCVIFHNCIFNFKSGGNENNSTISN